MDAVVTSDREANYLVRFHELQPLFGLDYSKRHLRLLEKQGKFPKRVYLTPQRVAWTAKSLREYISNLEGGRNNG